MYELKNICMIFDLDGFQIKKNFLTRELGYCFLTSNSYGSYRFNLKKYASSLTPKDWKTVLYVKHNIHGLPFRPQYKEECYDIADLQNIIKNLYLDSKTNEKSIVAFKGGHVEEDICIQLNLPYTNLEDFGCPRYDHLREVEIPDCGFHISSDRNFHCPMKEVVAFRNWVLENE